MIRNFFLCYSNSARAASSTTTQNDERPIVVATNVRPLNAEYSRTNNNEISVQLAVPVTDFEIARDALRAMSSADNQTCQHRPINDLVTPQDLEITETGTELNTPGFEPLTSDRVSILAALHVTYDVVNAVIGHVIAYNLIDLEIFDLLDNTISSLVGSFLFNLAFYSAFFCKQDLFSWCIDSDRYRLNFVIGMFTTFFSAAIGATVLFGEDNSSILATVISQELGYFLTKPMFLVVVFIFKQDNQNNLNADNESDYSS